MAITFEQCADMFLNRTNPTYDECQKSIDGLDKILVSVHSSNAPILRSYFVPILYAYWERFFCNAFTEFLACLALAEFEPRRLTSALAKTSLKRKIAELSDPPKIKLAIEIASKQSADSAEMWIEQLDKWTRCPLEIKDPENWIITESNVGFEVLSKNCSNFGVNIGEIAKYLQRSGFSLETTLKKLVDARNSIAHGEVFHPQQQTEWRAQKEFVIFLMAGTQDVLFETLKGGKALVR